MCDQVDILTTAGIREIMEAQRQVRSEIEEIFSKYTALEYAILGGAFCNSKEDRITSIKVVPNHRDCCSLECQHLSQDTLFCSFYNVGIKTKTCNHDVVLYIRPVECYTASQSLINCPEFEEYSARCAVELRRTLETSNQT